MSGDFTLFGRFRSRATISPDALAVVDGATRMNYGELLERAESLAGELEGDSPVAVSSLRGTEMAVGILAVLAAGRVFVPLDPRFPEDRLKFMREDSGTGLLLRDGTIDFSSERRGGTSPDDLACIFYTSGSTGRPKGVAMGNRFLVEDMVRQGRDMKVVPGDRFDLLFSWSFSAALAPFFAALLHGASVHCFDAKSRLPELAGWLATQAITVSSQTVTSYRFLCGSVSPGANFPAMRMISIGGEPVRRNDVQLFERTFHGNCRLQITFAATETRANTQRIIAPGDELEEDPVHVGWPVEGRTLLVVDERNEPLPEGETGEIVVRGRHLADGYWRRADLTEKAFVTRGNGEREYRTGDRGRIRPDGSLVLSGRTDEQVKVRGHRVEPGEIESALLSIEGVRESAVVPVGGSLHAFVSGKGLRPEDLRRALADLLPAHAIPSRVSVLSVLPVTSTGKADRRRLREKAVDERRTPSAAGPGLEGKIRALLAGKLGRERVGLHDDFFRLGGDSIGAAELVTGVARFVPRASPAALLSGFLICPTAAGLIAASSVDGTERFVSLREGEAPGLFLFPSIAGQPQQFLPLAEAMTGDRRVMGYLYPPKVVSSIDDLAGPAVSEIVRRQPEGPYHVAGYSFGIAVAHAVACRLAREGRRVGLFGSLDAPVPGTRYKFQRPAGAEGWWRFSLNVAPWGLDLVGRYPLRWIVSHGANLFSHLVSRRKGGGESLGDLLEMHEFGEEQGKVMDARFRAGENYVAPAFPGRVVLFRARIQPLWCRHTRDMDWNRVAERAVVRPVPGHHDTCIYSPYKSALAGALERELMFARGG